MSGTENLAKPYVETFSVFAHILQNIHKQNKQITVYLANDALKA